MAKGQKRSNREIKKPKTKKQPAPHVESSLINRALAPMTPLKKKS